jgi:hypothetical protein
VPCAAHPDAPEQRRCTACDARWCLACVVAVRMSKRATCPTCGHLVVSAAPVLTAREQLADAVRRVRSRDGILTSLGLAACFAASRWIPVLLLVYVATLVSYYFAIIHHVGEGDTGMPGPEDATADWSETLAQVMRGVMCLIAASLPLLAYFIAEHDFPSTAGTLALLFAGQVYLPAAILAGTLTNTALAIMWPPTWIAIIRRAPAHYARFMMLWFGSVAVILCAVLATAPFVDGALILRETTEAPLTTYGVGAFVASAIWNLLGFAQAVVVGLFLRTHRDALWGDAA